MACQEAGLLPLGIGPIIHGGGGGLFSDFALGGSEVAAFLGTLFLGVLEGRGLSTGM